MRVCTYRNVTVYMIGVLSEMSEEQIENIEILKCFEMMYKLNKNKQVDYLDRLEKIFAGVDGGVRQVNVAELWLNYVTNRKREEKMEADAAMEALGDLLAASTESPPRKRQRVERRLEYFFV